MNALFITPEDIKEFTMMSGNLDDDKFIHSVKVAQDLDLQDKLGSNLFEKIEAEIIAGTLSGLYLAFVKTFVKPVLIHWGMVRYLPFAPYTLANKGMFKHTSENAAGVSQSEVTSLIKNETSIAEHYTSRMIDYLVANKSDFPEYSTNTSEDMHPSTNPLNGGWMLD